VFKIILFLTLYMSFAFGHDLGKHGHTYPIEEMDFIDYLQEQMTKDNPLELSEFLENLNQRKIESLKSPAPVKGIYEAVAYSLREYDPSITSNQDILDLDGNIIVKKGARINPLELVPLSRSLLFFDGSNRKHVEWAKKQPDTCWVLVRGSPFELEEKENRPVYYDQSGVLVNRFSIKHVPTRISQKGNLLIIEEFPIKFEEENF